MVPALFLFVVIIAMPQAQLRIGQVKGIVSAPLPSFPKSIGWGAALDLLMSGRVFYAEEALELGMVKEVVAPDELLGRAVEYAEDIAANCAPSALAVIKRQVYGDALREATDASQRAETLMHESMQRPDFIEGITAFFEKRTPNFPPLT